MRLALATAAELPDLIPDDALLLAALDRAGVGWRIGAWTDPAFPWADFDAVLVRTTWDYTTRLPEFLAWARRVERVAPLLNPADTLAWNTHKRYLRELEAAGVRTPPLELLAHRGPADLRAILERRGWRDAVIKPAIGAGARRQERCSLDERAGFLTLPRAQAVLDEALREEEMLVQEYLPEIETRGEASLVYFAGEFSHAMRKTPAPGDYRAQMKHGGRYAPARATDAETALALHALRAAGADRMPYARVDLAPWRGEPALIELELVEPQLFFEQGPGSADRFAEALRRALAQA